MPRPPITCVAAAALLLCTARIGGTCPMDPDGGATQPVMVRPTAATVTGGQDAQFTVTLEGLTTYDRAVALTTDEPGAFLDLPESVVVPAGYSSVTVDVATCEVSAQLVATVFLARAHAIVWIE